MDIYTYIYFLCPLVLFSQKQNDIRWHHLHSIDNFSSLWVILCKYNQVGVMGKRINFKKPLHHEKTKGRRPD